MCSSISNAKQKDVFLTVFLVNDPSEVSQVYLSEASLGNDLKSFISFQVKNIKFKTIVTSNREDAVTKMTKILDPDEVISGLHIVAHGNNTRSENGTLSTTSQKHIGLIESKYDSSKNIYTGRLSVAFERFFAPIREKIKSNANIVFTSCKNFDSKNTKFNNSKATVIADFFGIKNGSVYFSSTYDNNIFFLNTKDYTSSRFSEEYFLHFLKAIVAMSIVFGISNGPVDNLDTVIKIGLESVLAWAVWIEPLKFIQLQLAKFFTKTKISGWLYVFKDGILDKYEIKDKRSSYSKVFQVDSSHRSPKLICNTLFH